MSTFDDRIPSIIHQAVPEEVWRAIDAAAMDLHGSVYLRLQRQTTATHTAMSQRVRMAIALATEATNDY